MPIKKIMLIFFIHGVATRDVKYAEPLKIAIKDEFKKQGKELPCNRLKKIIEAIADCCC
jgi:hypothetical protein